MSILGQILSGLFGGSGSGLNDMGNYGNTNALNASFDAQAAKQTANQAQTTAGDLRDRLDRLALVCMAMWELMKASGLTEEQLQQKVKEIDLADGIADGRVSRTPEIAHCSKCGHVMSRRHVRCIYCGSENLQFKPFDATL